MRTILRVTGACAVALLLAGCVLSAAERHPAAKAVEGLLKARHARSTDPERYARYLESSDVATALAEDASSTASGGKPALPGWQRPYVSALTSGGADVVVVWKDDDDLPDWSRVADVFETVQVGERWVVTDARAVEGSAVPGPWKP